MYYESQSAIMPTDAAFFRYDFYQAVADMPDDCRFDGTACENTAQESKKSIKRNRLTP
jgi:hypothetical protein